jgi:malonate transporter and related proteins
MQQTFTLVIPIFAVIAMGWVTTRRKFIEPTGFAALNGFAYWVALPSLLFGSIAKMETRGLIDVALVYLSCCVAVYACAMALGALFFKRSFAQAAMFGLNSTYGNVIYFGTPLVSAAFGPQALAVILAIIAVHSGVLLPLTALLIEIGSRSQGNIRTAFQNTAINLLKNPIIMSILIGFAWRGTGLGLPSAVQNLLTLLGNAAAPLALFCLGAALPTTVGRSLISSEAVLAVIIKLAILPFTVGLVASKIGLSDLAWRVAVLTAAVPTGANAILLARRDASFSEASANIVVLATALSVLTIPMILGWVL